MRRLDHVRRLRASAMRQLTDVERELAELRRVQAAEERDVDKLERRTLTSIVAGALGARDERLAKERAEADMARLRVDGHDARLRQLTVDVNALDRELGQLADAPRQYDQALVDAERAMRDTGDPRAATLTEIAIRIADITADLREYREAQEAGEAALGAVAAVLKPLGAAQGWSTADMFSGSFADLVEHDRWAGPRTRPGRRSRHWTGSRARWPTSARTCSRSFRRSTPGGSPTSSSTTSSPTRCGTGGSPVRTRRPRKSPSGCSRASLNWPRTGPK